jgi:protein-S-isoprenylcysteine O-methyltransferase Ste14
MRVLFTTGWFLCVVYSTIPLFWLMIHPRADKLRERKSSPYRILLLAWILTWIVFAAVTAPWRSATIYSAPGMWVPASFFFLAGIFLYSRARASFTLAQFVGLPEVRRNYRGGQLVTTGIRARVRHPIYLAHLCEMLAWSLGTGLLVCWLLTTFAVVTGAVMIRLEDAELEKRFGEQFVTYRDNVPAILPTVRTWLKAES